MPTFPQAVIPAFPAGFAPLTTDFGAWIGNTFGFLSAQPLFRGIQQLPAGQLLASGAVTTLQIGGTAGDILEDPYGGWSHAGTPSHPADSFLVPFTGLYEVTVTCPTLAAAVWLAAAVTVSGAAPAYGDLLLAPASVAGGCSASLIAGCTGGQDYLQAGVFASGTATTDTTAAGHYPSAEIAYVSAG